MEDVYCYSFVEDAPSAAIVRRMAEYRNRTSDHRLLFFEGFPEVMRGNGNLAKKCPSFLNMAKSGLYVVCVTDLDTIGCPCFLLAEWFGLPASRASSLPEKLIFRIAVREIESWIMADIHGWSEFIEIPAANFSQTPDELSDPKQFLLGVLRNKGKKKKHAEMLPRGVSHIGPRYNETLCRFVETTWSPERAAKHSPSLKRAIHALQRI